MGHKLLYLQTAARVFRRCHLRIEFNCESMSSLVEFYIFALYYGLAFHNYATCNKILDAFLYFYCPACINYESHRSLPNKILEIQVNQHFIYIKIKFNFEKLLAGIFSVCSLF